MKASKVDVEIVRETPKAALVRDGKNREAWVQKRSLKDNQVNAATWEKAVEKASERKASYAAERDFKNAKHPVHVVKETEKAIAVEFVLENGAEQSWKATAWFPKSQCDKKDDIWEVPGWLYMSREQDVVMNARQRGGWIAPSEQQPLDITGVA